MADINDMLRDIELTVTATRNEIGRDQLAGNVMAAMKKVRRELFVPREQKVFAYHDNPLPIGHQQTISQPYIVALMTDLLDLQSDHCILEIGTGCGYQAAILSELVKVVYTIEIIEPLQAGAQARLRRLGYNNVYSQCADGHQGWPQHAPFDGIIITAACDRIPEPLLEQLCVGGKMVVPVGSSLLGQSLLLLTKQSETRFSEQTILAVRFVPLTGHS